MRLIVRSCSIVRGPALPLMISGALATSLTPSALSATPRARGHAAGVISASDTAELRYDPRTSEGATLIEEGQAKGSLPGWIKAEINTGTGATFSGSFQFRTLGGVINGRGRARLSGSKSNGIESFAGSMTVTGGTGRYLHVRGSAGLYGLFYRRSERDRTGHLHHTYDVTVQTTGTIHD